MEDDKQMTDFIPLRVEEVEVLTCKDCMYKDDLNQRSQEGTILFTNDGPILSGHFAEYVKIGIFVDAVMAIVISRDGKWIQCGLQEEATLSFQYEAEESFEAFLNRSVNSHIRFAAIKLQAYKLYKELGGQLDAAIVELQNQLEQTKKLRDRKKTEDE